MRLFAVFRALIAVWCLIGLDPAWAGTPGQDKLLFGRPGWVLSGASVDMNFTTGQYFGLSPGQLTVSRASTEYEICNGQLFGPFANNALAVTPGCGAWAWEARTNSIRNNTMQGAVAGSPGTLPTNWFIGFNGNGLSSSIIGSGVQNGINYVDVNINGTAVNTNQVFIGVDSATITSASYGQTWMASTFFAFVGGITTNISSVGIGLNEREGSSGGTGNFSTSVAVGSLPLAISGTPYTLSGTFTDPNATYAWLTVVINLASTGTVNFTLRIGAPQLELNPNIPASVASATVAGGGAAFVGASGTMTWSGAGCATNPVLNVTTSAGAINAVTSVATAGSCATFPAAGATTWTPGGGLSAGTGATFNLVPVDNSAKAFATGPILTSGAAVTRAATVVSTSKSCLNPSLLLSGTPYAPTANNVTQIAAQIDDGTLLNQLQIGRVASTGGLIATAFNGGVSGLAGPSGTWAQAASGKLSAAYSGGTVTGVFNNGTPATASLAGSIAPSVLRIGGGISGATPFNGSIARLAVACGQSLTGN